MRTHAFYLSNTAAAITLALGFKPDWVRIPNIVTGIKLEWNRCLLNNAAAYAGIKTVANGTRSLLTAGTGVALYTGGAKVVTSAAAVQTPVYTNPA
ncbi:MAG: hypothetical protein NTY53_24055, partial [Kiritimatiellaeota bacterium]|nr:hypothetical protein [Kiritimatiellota bacterium]